MNASRRSPNDVSSGKRFGGLIATIIFFIVFGAFLLWRSDRQVASEDALLRADSSTSSTKARAPAPSAKSVSSAGARRFTYSPTDNNEDVARKRLERSRHTLEGYKLWARYPPTSRPLSEMPDLQKPHSVQPSTHPIATDKGGVTQKARVTLQQDRLYLVGDEAARMQITCKVYESPAPCEVLSAQATSAPTLDNSAMVGPTSVTFATNEQGVAIGTIQPAKEGFSSYHGGIGIDVKLRIGNEEGIANFQLIYTPAAPARFTGKFREAMESGSLCMYVEMDVTKAGRYVLAARLDDADDEGFGYLEFNDLLETGLREAKMCAFGLLVLDQKAKTPFTLRDLEGFLLLEDRNPDRELLALIEGKAYTTKSYPESAFSSAEWESDEKTRHLNEFNRDVEKASDEVGEP